jgi:predicted protein tyrosine phosphatase
MTIELPPFNPPPRKRVLGADEVMRIMRATGEDIVSYADPYGEPIGRTWLRKSFHHISKTTLKKLSKEGKIKLAEQKRTYSTEGAHYIQSWVIKERVELIVHSRQSIERFPDVRSPADEHPPYCIISITSYPEFPKIYKTPWIKGLLRIRFDDGGAEHSNVLTVMEEQHAREIWDFVLKHHEEVGLIVCQCDAGVSRSAAVAAAIADWLGQNSQRFIESDRYLANQHVYRLMGQTAPALPGVK